MRIRGQLFGFVLGLYLVSQAHAGIRCGNDLITVGETSFEVLAKLQNCGHLIDRTPVATRTETKQVGREVVTEKHLIERWYIRVDEKGGTYCYPLIFEQGILKEIGEWRRCD